MYTNSFIRILFPHFCTVLTNINLKLCIAHTTCLYFNFFILGYFSTVFSIMGHLIIVSQFCMQHFSQCNFVNSLPFLLFTFVHLVSKQKYQMKECCFAYMYGGCLTVLYNQKVLLSLVYPTTVITLQREPKCLPKMLKLFYIYSPFSALIFPEPLHCKYVILYKLFQGPCTVRACRA